MLLPSHFPPVHDKCSESGDNFKSSLRLSFYWTNYSVSILSYSFQTIKVGSTLIRNLEGLPNIEDDSEFVTPEEAFRIVEKKTGKDESKEKSCIKIDNVPLRKLKNIVARKKKGKYRLTANRPTLKKKGIVL